MGAGRLAVGGKGWYKDGKINKKACLDGKKCKGGVSAGLAVQSVTNTPGLAFRFSGANSSSLYKVYKKYARTCIGQKKAVTLRPINRAIMKHPILLSVLLALLPLSLCAYDFESDGLCYNVLDSARQTVEVTYRSAKRAGNYPALTSLSLPDTVSHQGRTYRVVRVGDSAFQFCTALTTVTLPHTITAIGHNAFYSCPALRSVSLSASITTLGSGAFLGCSSLAAIALPEHLRTIGGRAFSDCTALTAIVIPASVRQIEVWAFDGCTALREMQVAPDNPTYDSREGCNAIIQTATNTLIAACTATTIPASVTAIGDYAFSYCTGITSLRLPQSVTTIGKGAFYGCSGLTAISLPEHLTTIGEEAFKNCSALTAIDLPASVTAIGDYAFYGCPASPRSPQ